MQSQNIGNNLRNFLFSKSLLSRLVLINVSVWLFTAFINVVGFLFQTNNLGLNDWLFNFFGLHANIYILLKTPWTLVSYMFIHTGFWHLLFNMIMLYFGGILFSQYLGQRKFVYTYFLGGLAGALIFILAYNLFPVFAPIKDHAIIVGASAAILSVFFGVATYIPNFEIRLFIFGRIKLKYLVFLFVLIDLIGIPMENPGGHLAHLGGALYGFLSIWLPRNFKRKNIKTKKFRATKKQKIENSSRPLTDEEYNYNKAQKQKEIDTILDKISKSGYESLNSKEKKTLFESKEK